MVAPAQTPLTHDVTTTARQIDTDGPIAAAMKPVIEGSFGAKIPIRFEFWDGSTRTIAIRPWRDVGSTRPTRSGECCGCPTSSDSAGRTWRANSSSTATSSTSSRPSATPTGSPCRSGVEDTARRGHGREPHRCARTTVRLRPPRRRGCRAGATRCGATAQAITHHYDVGNDFYRLVLGPDDDVLVRPIREPTTSRSRMRRPPSTS